MKIREHKGLLADSMETIRDIEPTFESLIECIKKSFESWPSFSFLPEQIKIEPYCFDERIGWNTYIVTIDGYGVFGFTDGDIRQRKIIDEKRKNDPIKTTKE